MSAPQVVTVEPGGALTIKGAQNGATTAVEVQAPEIPAAPDPPKPVDPWGPAILTAAVALLGALGAQAIAHRKTREREEERARSEAVGRALEAGRALVAALEVVEVTLQEGTVGTVDRDTAKLSYMAAMHTFSGRLDVYFALPGSESEKVRDALYAAERAIETFLDEGPVQPGPIGAGRVKTARHALHEQLALAAAAHRGAPEPRPEGRRGEPAAT